MHLDAYSTTLINRADYSISELLTLIAQQILVGNYTNYNLFLNTLALPVIKQCGSFDIQDCIDQMKAKCMEQQTEKPCHHALTLMGTLYLFGVGYPQEEYAKAISCFEKAMISNNSYALNNLGCMYIQGQGPCGSSNPEEAIRFFQIAVEFGNPLAMNNLAMLYEERGGTDNIANAIALYEQAAKSGYAIAMINLAMLYEKQGDTDNIDKAIALYQQAAELEHVAAMVNLGMLYEKQGGSDNIDKAIKLYQRATELGHAVAMSKLARLHQQQGYIAKAIVLYQQAIIVLGDAEDMNSLAYLYQRQGGTDNTAKAIALFQQAIDKDEVKAMNNLAIIYKRKGDIDSMAKAIALYERAIRGGNKNALCNLTRLYQNSDITKNQEQFIQHLLPLIWKDLLAGACFTEQTISALHNHCQQEVIDLLKDEPEFTSIAFLKQFKLDPPHPLAIILSGYQIEEENKGLGIHTMNLLNTRWAFFRSKSDSDKKGSLKDLPSEIQAYIFSYVQPGYEKDSDNNHYLTTTYN